MEHNGKPKTPRKLASGRRTLPLVTSASQQKILMALRAMQARGELKGRPSHAVINAEIERLGYPALSISSISRAMEGLEARGYIHQPFVVVSEEAIA